MTIQYNTDNSFFRLVFRWKGSVWKMAGRHLIQFLVAYLILSVIWRLALNSSQQSTFQNVSKYFEQAMERIPLDVLVGFYVNQVVERWWSQFRLIAFPDGPMFWIVSTIKGTDAHSTMVRRTLARYMNLATVITWRKVSSRVYKRFPENRHLVQSGLMTVKEKNLLEAMVNRYSPYEDYFLPLSWGVRLLQNCREKGLLDDVQLDRLTKELNLIRLKCDDILFYDWVNIPLVYVQVATIATYGYFLFALIARQPSDSYDDSQRPPFDLFFPFMTVLQFVFYMGWLSVGEELCLPFGEDDEDFELNFILERNVQIAYIYAGVHSGEIPEFEKDTHWNIFNPKIHHTVASKKIQENIPVGHLAGYKLKASETDVIETQGEMEPQSIIELSVARMNENRKKSPMGRKQHRLPPKLPKAPRQ